MTKKPTLAAHFYEDEINKFEEVAKQHKRAGAAMMRVMLEDYLDGRVKLEPAEDEEEKRRMVSTTVDGLFKVAVNSRLREDGISLHDLIVRLTPLYAKK